MTKYECELFDGRCPYTDKLCARTIGCNECEREKEERQMMKEIKGDKEQK